MNYFVLLSFLFIFVLIPIQDSFSELEISTNSKVYSPDHTLQVYGNGLAEENLILRLFAPDESITKFEQIQTNSDGTFNHQLLTWPEPSSTVPYGTYVVEVLSTEQNGLSKKIMHILYVDIDEFKREKTEYIAKKIDELNKKLGEKNPYLLLGPGRWGTSDPWLGIPVTVSYTHLTLPTNREV